MQTSSFPLVPIFGFTSPKIWMVDNLNPSHTSRQLLNMGPHSPLPCLFSYSYVFLCSHSERLTCPLMTNPASSSSSSQESCDISVVSFQAWMGTLCSCPLLLCRPLGPPHTPVKPCPWRLGCWDTPEPPCCTHGYWTHTHPYKHTHTHLEVELHEQINVCA